MNSTGMVRRIDDLGRIVIPKGIRGALGIYDGDPLEISVDGDYIKLKKEQERICPHCKKTIGGRKNEDCC